MDRELSWTTGAVSTAQPTRLAAPSCSRAYAAAPASIDALLTATAMTSTGSENGGRARSRSNSTFGGMISKAIARTLVAAADGLGCGAEAATARQALHKPQHAE